MSQLQCAIVTRPCARSVLLLGVDSAKFLNAAAAGARHALAPRAPKPAGDADLSIMAVLARDPRAQFLRFAFASFLAPAPGACVSPGYFAETHPLPDTLLALLRLVLRQDVVDLHLVRAVAHSKPTPSNVDLRELMISTYDAQAPHGPDDQSDWLERTYGTPPRATPVATVSR